MKEKQEEENRADRGLGSQESRVLSWDTCFCQVSLEEDHTCLGIWQC